MLALPTLEVSPFAILGLGFVLGLRHAMDPDHVVAVAAITARTRRMLPAALLGAAWGAGHTVTVWGVGAAIIACNLVVPPRVGLALEFAVALALILVGFANLRAPGHDRSGLEGGHGRPPARRAFLVGLVHGLAGSAAVALLVLATVRDVFWACAYLGVFAVGTLAGMALVTTGLSLPLAALTTRFPASPRLVRLATGALSLGFGVWLAWQIGWQDGLFTATPSWSPH